MQGLITFYPAIMDVPDKPAQLISASAAYLTALFYPEAAWTCPVSGFWTFVARGQGSGYSSGAQSGGGAALRTVYLTAGQVVNLSIGALWLNEGATGNSSPGTVGESTVITFPDGQVMTATGGRSEGSSSQPPVYGTGIGGDVNVTATSANAPAIGPFPESTPAAGIDANRIRAHPPGVGAPSNGFARPGGPGVVYIYSTGQ